MLLLLFSLPIWIFYGSAQGNAALENTRSPRWVVYVDSLTSYCTSKGPNWSDLTTAWGHLFLCLSERWHHLACSPSSNPKHVYHYKYYSDTEEQGFQDAKVNWNGRQTVTLGGICGHVGLIADVSDFLASRPNTTTHFTFSVSVPEIFNMNVTWMRFNWGIFDDGFNNGRSRSHLNLQFGLNQYMKTGFLKLHDQVVDTSHIQIDANIHHNTYHRYQFWFIVMYQAHDSSFSTLRDTAEVMKLNLPCVDVSRLFRSSKNSQIQYQVIVKSTLGSLLRVTLRPCDLLHVEVQAYDGPTTACPLVYHKQNGGILSEEPLLKASAHVMLLNMWTSEETTKKISIHFKEERPELQEAIELDGTNSSVSYEASSCFGYVSNTCTVKITSKDPHRKFILFSVQNTSGMFHDDMDCLYGGIALWEVDDRNVIVSTKAICIYEHLTLFTRIYTKTSTLIAVYISFPSLQQHARFTANFETTSCMGIDINLHAEMPKDLDSPLEYEILTKTMVKTLTSPKVWLDFSNYNSEVIIAQVHRFTQISHGLGDIKLSTFRLKRFGLWHYNISILPAEDDMRMEISPVYDFPPPMFGPWMYKGTPQWHHSLTSSNYFTAHVMIPCYFEMLVTVSPTCSLHQLYVNPLWLPAHSIGLPALANTVYNTSALYDKCPESTISATGVSIATVNHPSKSSCRYLRIEKDPRCPSKCTHSEDVVLLTVYPEGPPNLMTLRTKNPILFKLYVYLFAVVSISQDSILGSSNPLSVIFVAWKCSKVVRRGTSSLRHSAASLDWT